MNALFQIRLCGWFITAQAFASRDASLSSTPSPARIPNTGLQSDGALSPTCLRSPARERYGSASPSKSSSRRTHFLDSDLGDGVLGAS